MVQFVRSGGEMPAELAQHIAPDIEIEFLPPALGSNLGGEGLAGMIAGWREWLEPYESYVITIEDFEEVGENDVYIPVRVHARTHRDGVVVEHAPAALATIRDGVLVRMRFYLDRDLARGEAGGG
jgi:ketosteroid isomerase-like protein